MGVIGHRFVDGKDRERLLSAFYQTLAWGAELTPLETPLCFFPRHGVRARALEIAICFECKQIRIGSRHRGATIERVGQPVFDALLREAGLAIAPQLH